MTTIRPLVFSALRSPGRLGAPMSSRTTSNGPWSSKPSGATTSCGAEPLHVVAERLVAHGGGDVRARRPAELHRGGPDAARRAVDEEALAGTQSALDEDRVVGGREDLGQPAGLRPVQALGDRHELALVDDRELRLAAAADDRHDAFAFAEARRARAAALDLTGELEARDVRRRAGRRGIGALALEHVGAVEPGGADADENLAGARLGVGMLLDDHLAVADGGGAHGRGV